MSTPSPTSPVDITVYWRPGCGFCMALRGQLDAMDVPYAAINIWDTPEGADFVRAHNGGNELVPTVKVGERVLSNPPAAAVLQAAHEQDPGTDLPTPPEPGPVANGIRRLLGG